MIVLDILKMAHWFDWYLNVLITIMTLKVIPCCHYAGLATVQQFQIPATVDLSEYSYDYIFHLVMNSALLISVTSISDGNTNVEQMFSSMFYLINDAPSFNWFHRTISFSGTNSTAGVQNMEITATNISNWTCQWIFTKLSVSNSTFGRYSPFL